MRSEVGKISLDKTFEERDMLNANIVQVLNSAAADWGIECLRYEIRDIAPPDTIRNAMEMQAEAERRKRAVILESEGQQQREINMAEGAKTAQVLRSEAEFYERKNHARGEAAAILLRAEAKARGLRNIAEAIGKSHGHDAVSVAIAEKYLDAFSNLAKETNTMILPAGNSDPSSMVAQSMAMYKTILKDDFKIPQAAGAASSGSNDDTTPVTMLDDELLDFDTVIERQGNVGGDGGMSNGAAGSDGLYDVDMGGGSNEGTVRGMSMAEDPSYYRGGSGDEGSGTDYRSK
eukprot:GFYU01026594.1.p1 GENE.GFYU01026594.1~~GFYU01026594.1.p1  ORF type:complete len:339 (+),score=82.73 GFYU01026594.1:150-1019(+)